MKRQRRKLEFGPRGGRIGVDKIFAWLAAVGVGLAIVRGGLDRRALRGDFAQGTGGLGRLEKKRRCRRVLWAVARRGSGRDRPCAPAKAQALTSGGIGSGTVAGVAVLPSATPIGASWVFGCVFAQATNCAKTANPRLASNKAGRVCMAQTRLTCVVSA